MSNDIVLPEIPVKEIFAALRKTSAGRSLQRMLRFGLYKDPKETSVHWKKILGPSAATYTHMQYLYYFLSNFLKNELSRDPALFNREKQRVLLMASSCHDFGEAIIDGEGIGDIAAPLKNKKHEEKEREMFERVLGLLKLDKNIISELKEAYQNVVVENSSHLHRFFRAVEKTEYIDTILKTYKKCTNGYKLVNQKLLIRQVLSYDLPFVIEYSKEFYSVKKYLFINANHITGAIKFSSNGYIKTGDIEKTYQLWMDCLDNLLLYFKTII